MRPTAFGGLVMNAAEFAIYSEVVRPLLLLLLLLLHGGAYRLGSLGKCSTVVVARGCRLGFVYQ